MRETLVNTVVWNGIPLLTPLTGVGQYTAHLIQALSQTNDLAIEVFLAKDWCPGSEINRLLAEGQNPTSVEAKLARAALWRRYLARIPAARKLARYRQNRFFQQGAAIRKARLYHEPNFVAFPFDGPLVLTVHDLSFYRHPETHPAERVRFMTQNIQRSLERAQTVITVSHFIGDEIHQTFGASIGHKVKTVYNGVSQAFYPRTESETNLLLQKHQLNYRQFILAVGTIEPRKNLLTLIRAYTALPQAIKGRYPLIIAGPMGWHSEQVEKELARYRHEPIKWLGYLPQDELPLLYAAAKLFVYPSIYEGFGLPVLEAMASATPTLAANNSALPEVLGPELAQHGWGFEAMNTDMLTQKINQALDDEPYWQTASTLALALSKRFSWDKAAQELRGVYNALL